MFAFLRGNIYSKEMMTGPADKLVLDVGGVGYELSVSRRTLVSLGNPGIEALVYTSLAIRENEWTIFGFATPEERQIFSLLQSVTGVGPKLALGLVATLGPGELAQAILAGDQKLISQAPGVGLKVAQRLILELKGKMEEWLQQRQIAVEPRGAGAFNQVGEEVRMILDGLGYTASEVNMAIKRAKEDGLDEDVEQMVRYSLKVLGANAVP
ncbi:MAG TPA: Holliday junction branch migration protein RuvA [Planktothrix sp.]|jgi:Holliday junction DNA helicase RuvA